MTGIVKRVRSDGIELTVETTGKGSPLVFAHGLTSKRHRTLEELAPLERDYTIIAFDQRGHGDSTPVTDPALYDPHRMASDMATVLDYLGIRRAIIGGESMGAATALLFCLRWPERVEKLLLTGPAFGDALNPGHEDLKNMGRLIEEGGIEGCLAASIPEWVRIGYNEAAIAAWCEVQRTHDPASLALACKIVADWVILPDLGAAAALDVPAQIIGWEGDPVHPLALARRLAGILPQARLCALPGLAPVFNESALVGRIYSEFLDGF